MSWFVSGENYYDTPKTVPTIGLTEYTVMPEDVAQLGENPQHKRGLFAPTDPISIPIVAGGNPGAQPTVPGTVDNWTMYDDIGDVYRTGGPIPSGQPFQTAAATLGFYHWRAQRASPIPYFRREQGAGTILVARPQRDSPAFNDPMAPTGGIGGKFGAEDIGMLCMVMMGMVRGRIDNISTPIVQDEIDWNGNLYDVMDSMYHPYQLHREKPVYTAITDGHTYSNGSATVNATEQQFKTWVGQLVSHAAYLRVNHWSGMNEPGGSANFGEWFIEPSRWLYEAIHATGLSNKYAVSPNTVGFTENTLPGLLRYAQQGGFQWCDRIGLHAYNWHNRDLAIGRRMAAKIKTITNQYAPGKKLMNTESVGMIAMELGAGTPVRQAQRAIMDVLLNEGLLGIPKEYQSIYHSQFHGDPHPSALKAGGLFTAYGPLLHHNWEIGNCEQFSGMKPLEFGTDENVLYGNEYERHDGSGRVMNVMNCGRRNPTAQFRVTAGNPASISAGTMKWEGSFPVEDGIITVPLGWSPTYLRVPDGVDLEYVEPRRGRRLNGSAMSLVLENVQTAGGTVLNSVLSGEIKNARSYDRDPSEAISYGAWRPSQNIDQLADHRMHVDLPVSIDVKWVRVTSAPPDQNLGVPSHLVLESRQNGAWVEMGEIVITRTDIEWRNWGLYNSFRIAFDDDTSIFEIDMTGAPVHTNGVRLRVLDATAGAAPTPLAGTGYGATKPRTVTNSPRIVEETDVPIDNSGFIAARNYSIQRIEVWGGDDPQDNDNGTTTGPSYTGPQKVVVAL